MIALVRCVLQILCVYEIRSEEQHAGAHGDHHHKLGQAQGLALYQTWLEQTPVLIYKNQAYFVTVEPHGHSFEPFLFSQRETCSNPTVSSMTCIHLLMCMSICSGHVSSTCFPVNRISVKVHRTVEHC